MVAAAWGEGCVKSAIGETLRRPKGSQDTRDLVYPLAFGSLNPPPIDRRIHSVNDYYQLCREELIAYFGCHNNNSVVGHVTWVALELQAIVGDNGHRSFSQHENPWTWAVFFPNDREYLNIHFMPGVGNIIQR